MTDKDDREIRRHLTKFIPQRMQELGMNQSDLARATGDSTAQINRTLGGKSTPSSAFARRLARALECTCDELLANHIFAPQ